MVTIGLILCGLFAFIVWPFPAIRRQSKIRKLTQGGYRVVEVPRNGISQLDYLTETLIECRQQQGWLHISFIKIFHEARRCHFEACSETSQKAWDAYCSGKITSVTYVDICNAAQDAYNREGDLLVARQIAEGIRQETVEFARRALYDVKFPRVTKPAYRPSIQKRSPHEAGDGPMRDITPQKPALTNRRTYH